jgi:hypothetical protein
MASPWARWPEVEATLILAAASSAVLVALAASIAYDGITKRPGQKAIPALDRNWNKVAVQPGQS